MIAQDTFDIKIAENNRRILLTVKQSENYGEKKYDIYNDRNVIYFLQTVVQMM